MGSSAFEHYALLRADSATKGNRLGHRLQAFKDDIDRPLAAILTLNTIAHTVGAIGVGDQAARIWADANSDHGPSGTRRNDSSYLGAVGTYSQNPWC